MRDRNVELVMELYEAFGRGDVAAVSEALAAGAFESAARPARVNAGSTQRPETAGNAGLRGIGETVD